MNPVDRSSCDVPPEREKLTKKAITADHPTWCPACGDFAVLASFYKVLEKRQLPHENIVTLAGIGCSSRFPYFVNSHGAHFIHGRAVPLASAISLARPDLHVFLFGGDGDGFLDRRKSSRSRRAQKHPADLRDHGQFRLWPDEETDLANLAHWLSIQDRPHRSDRSSGQSDQKTHRCRRHFRRAHACGAG